MRIRLTTRATADLELGYEHYAEIAPDLGDKFLDDVDAAVERLEMFPDGAPPVEGFDGMRRARMRRFPYGISYQRTSTGTELLIVRVLHSRRDRPDAPEHPDS